MWQWLWQPVVPAGYFLFFEVWTCPQLYPVFCPHISFIRNCYLLERFAENYPFNRISRSLKISQLFMHSWHSYTFSLVVILKREFHQMLKTLMTFMERVRPFEHKNQPKWSQRLFNWSQRRHHQDHCCNIIVIIIIIFTGRSDDLWHNCKLTSDKLTSSHSLLVNRETAIQHCVWYILKCIYMDRILSIYRLAFSIAFTSSLLFLALI